MLLPAAQSRIIGVWTEGLFGGCLAMIYICDFSCIVVSFLGNDHVDWLVL